MGDETAFYATVAGLIPVLVLAGVLEFQGITRREAEQKRSLTDLRITMLSAIAFALIAANGEVRALNAVLHGPTERSQFHATTTLVFLGYILFLGMIAPAARNLEAAGAQNAVKYTRIGLGVAFAAISIALAVLV